MILALLLACAPAAVPAAPGTLVVVIDTLRADLGGADAPDWLPDDARTYTQAWSTAPYTTAATAAILTGLPPTAHGMPRHPAEGPHALGVPTWLDGDNAALVSDSPLVPLLGGLTGAGVYRWTEARPGPADGSYAAAHAARSWISEQSEPWTAYVHLLGPHGPWSASPSDRKTFVRAQELQHEPAEEWVTWLALSYRTAVGDSLGVVGSLVEGLPEGTTVVITSDHGEDLGDGGTYGHGRALVDPVLHVPMWAWGPGIDAGEDDAPISTACVAAVAGIAASCGVRPRAWMVDRDGQWQTRTIGGPT